MLPITEYTSPSERKSGRREFRESRLHTNTSKTKQKKVKQLSFSAYSGFPPASKFQRNWRAGTLAVQKTSVCHLRGPTRDVSTVLNNCEPIPYF